MNEEQRKSFEVVATNSAVAAIQFALKDVEANLAPLLAEIERLRAEVERLREAAWQPIETCPSVERVVMFCDERNNIWTDVACNKSADCTGFPPKYWRDLPVPPTPPNKEAASGPADWSMTYAERKAAALLAMHNAIGLDYARAAEDLRKEQARQQREGHDHG